MFLTQHCGYRLGLHPLDGFETAAAASAQDAIDDAAGLVGTERLVEDLAHIFIGVHAERGLLFHARGELPEHAADFLARYAGQLRHRRTDFLHFLGAQEPKHLGRVLFTKRQQQYCRLLDPGTTAGLYFGHHSLTQVLTTCATRLGSCATSVLACTICCS